LFCSSKEALALIPAEAKSENCCCRMIEAAMGDVRQELD